MSMRIFLCALSFVLAFLSASSSSRALSLPLTHQPAQVVLLDVSLPRFYLILIEGSLIFDRKDLTLSASYILLRGGMLRVAGRGKPRVLLGRWGRPLLRRWPSPKLRAV